MHEIQKMTLKALSEAYLTEVKYLRELYPDMSDEVIRDMYSSMKMDTLIAVLDMIGDGRKDADDELI